jgi:hypothetical protein
MAGRATVCVLLALLSVQGHAQLIDKHRMPNTANEGINKSLAEEIGQGRGFETCPILPCSSSSGIRSAPSGVAASYSNANLSEPKDKAA